MERGKDCFGKSGHPEDGRGRGAGFRAKAHENDRAFKVFFYKNPEVRSEIDRAMEQQAGTTDPRRSILDKAMDGRIELLQQQVAKLKQENEQLQKENQKLKKALSKQDRNTIRNL